MEVELANTSMEMGMGAIEADGSHLGAEEKVRGLRLEPSDTEGTARENGA